MSSKYLKASEFIKLSPDEFSKLSGKKLNFFERLSFSITKMRLKHDLKKNPDLLLTDYVKEAKHKGSFDWLWFLLGFAAPIIGILTESVIAFILIGISPIVIAYATKQDEVNRNSAWLGFGISFLILVITALIVLSSFGVGF